MILLHHFGSDGEPFYLNPELIISIEEKPDTIIRLLTGQELYVQENPSQIVDLVRDWRSSLLNMNAFLDGGEKHG
jgi:flagellar protein FlbD